MKTYKTSLLIAATLGASALCPSLLAATHDQDPKAIAAPAPKYPYELKRAEVEGAVLVSFTVTAKGEVADVVAVKSTEKDFEASAVSAVKGWKFAPAMKEGRAISIPVLQIVTFSLKGKERAMSVAALADTMRPQHPLQIAVSHDQCFCGSAKMFNACHGTADYLAVVAGW